MALTFCRNRFIIVVKTNILFEKENEKETLGWGMWRCGLHSVT